MSSLLTAIVVSACLGALVGLIRQWSDQRERPGEADFGGVRTYTFWAMLGCLGAAGQEHVGPALLLVLLGLAGALQIVLIVKNSHPTHPGGTTFAAMLLTIMVGALVYWGHKQTAVLIAATTMVMIGLKQTLHAWTRAFTDEDIRGTLQFVAITGVILPLVPDMAYGPFGAFNPYSTWLMVVLISGMGFIGYLLMRVLGAQAGITITGLAGGIASSTATTLAFSRRSKEDPELSSSCTLAVVLACTVMFGRILVMVGLIHPGLAQALLVPFAIMAAPGLLFSAWAWWTQRRQTDRPDVAAPHMRNPLSLSIAIKFALIYAAFAFLIKAATHLDWQVGILPLSFVSGLTDMDAIALLMAKGQTDGSVLANLATKAVILGAIGNSVTKASIAIALGSPALRRQTVWVLGATVVLGLGTLWLVG